MAKRRPRWLDERQQHLWQSYRHMKQRLYSTLEELIERQSGLSGADYAVLVPLSEEPTGLLRARNADNRLRPGSRQPHARST
jgi:hypothetical protein